MFLAVPVLMALIVQVLLNMLLHVQESAFPVWLTASYIMAVTHIPQTDGTACGNEQEAQTGAEFLSVFHKNLL